MREGKIEKTKVECGDDGNGNDERRVHDGLLLRRPWNMFEFGARIAQVVEESVHTMMIYCGLKNAPQGNT